MARNSDSNDHYKGLSGWVSDYKAMRTAGNVKGAEQLRDNISKTIQTHKLDSKKVWGKDPDLKS